jgi:PRC-barrel domain protein
MAKATTHPNHQLISSEDVEGTEVYGPDRENIGQIDHLMIDKGSGRVAYAVMSFGGFLGVGQPLPGAMGCAHLRHHAGRLPHEHHGAAAEGRSRVQR